MAVTAKELARELGLSQAAVSAALNDKPGVSTATRRRVLRAAEARGYDFTRIAAKKARNKSICFVGFHQSGVILQYAPIFDEILQGALQECQRQGYSVRVRQFYSSQQDLAGQIAELRVSDCCGIILLGTEIHPEYARQFLALPLPIVVVDTKLEDTDATCVLVNNQQGAMLAVNHLIRRCRAQPGCLRSSIPLRNFDERWEGFQKALRQNGMHPANSIVHRLAPTIAGAQADMQEILEQGEPLAACYFAENDLIAIGAVRALKAKGLRVPQDVAVAGFDNILEASLIEPPLTTISIPRHYMGRIAARQLIDRIAGAATHALQIQVSAELVERASV